VKSVINQEINISYLDTETAKKIRDFEKYVLEKFVKSYKIVDVTKEKTVGIVHAQVVYGFDPETINSIDVDGEVAALSDQYAKDHKKELAKIRKKDGEEAAMNEILKGITDDIIASLSKQINAGGEVTKRIRMTIENAGEKPKITSFAVE